MLDGGILSGALGQVLGQLLGELLEQPLERWRADRALSKAIAQAVVRAERRFAETYRAQDAELAAALTRSTRFADLPSVQTALRELLIQPFQEPAQGIAVLQRSFTDVLPERVERARVDAAVAAFLQLLGQEVLAIPQLQPLYSLHFQKTSAASSRLTASHTAALIEGMQALRADLRQLPAQTTPAPLTGPPPRPFHNLPQRPYSHFVGRQQELSQLARLLLPYPRSRHFLVTIDGIGGVGKSALALELAYGYRAGYAALPPSERFEAIVWASAKRTLLSAEGIQQRRQTFTTLDDLYQAIATTLDVPAILHAPLAQRRALVEQALSQQRTLLILDNLETIDDEELLSFLRELPDPTKAIVTTRHRIDVAYPLRLTGMERDEALGLMALEAQSRDVILDAEAQEALWVRSGGVPLAIVWSIALLGLGSSVESVIRRLGSGQSDIARFCFGESVARIRNTAAYPLLLALALFEHWVARDLLGDVAGLADDLLARDDGLAALLQLSLVEKKGERFGLLPLTQAFALDELRREAELERGLRARWVQRLGDLAGLYGDLHWRRPDRMRLRGEGRHMPTLAAWAQRSERLDLLVQILPALLSYYDLKGDWGALMQLAALGLEHARLTGQTRRVIETLIHGYAWVLSHQGRHAEASAAADEARQLAEHLGDTTLHCEVLVACAQVARRQGDYAAAQACCQAGLLLAATLDAHDQHYVRANLQYELGKIARDQHDWSAAQACFLAARAVFRPDEAEPRFNREFAWIVQCNLALTEHRLGDLDGAAQRYNEALAFFEMIGDEAYLPTVQVRLAALEFDRSQRARALDLARTALAGSKRLGSFEEQHLARQLLAALGETE